MSRTPARTKCCRAILPSKPWRTDASLQIRPAQVGSLNFHAISICEKHGACQLEFLPAHSTSQRCVTTVQTDVVIARYAREPGIALACAIDTRSIRAIESAASNRTRWSFVFDCRPNWRVALASACARVTSPVPATIFWTCDKGTSHLPWHDACTDIRATMTHRMRWRKKCRTTLDHIRICHP